ncbi:MAG: BON domain-containing protein [Nitrospiraceae bacterium]|nr:BON domain-containing protein [Nitrospiraceae bacterium]
MGMRVVSQSVGPVALSAFLCLGLATTGWGETSSESKGEAAPPQRPKDAEVKPKEPELKPAESKAKEPEPKQREEPPKVKEPESKPKESEAKPKETESKPKESEAKPKEPAARAKESEHKAKDPEQKAKDADNKAKDKEKDKEKESEVLADKPCPTPPPAAETKVAAEQLAPGGETGNGDRPKAAEPEVKKPMRSSMVTAKLALMGDPRLFPFDIEVDAKEKDLVLLGKVTNESEKRAATEIVRCLEGVRGVENRLKIESDAMHGLQSDRDKVLTQLVKERFEKSKTLQSVKFDVKTEDGIVTLTGTTRFQVIVLEAAQAARQVPGVRAVNTENVRLVAGE